MIPIDLSFLTIGIIGFVLLFTLLLIGLPIGFGMALVGFLGFAYIISLDAAYSKLALTSFEAAASYHFSVIPLFILMAHICFQAGFSTDLYRFAHAWLGRLPGGLAIASVAACALFAAVSASGLAAVVTFSLVAIPEMKKFNYDSKLAVGSVAAGGTMGALIPPSGALIIYGLIAEQSIGRLFIGGVIPGILEAVFYIIVITIWCKLVPDLGPPGPASSFSEKIKTLLKISEVLVLITFILGGLFAGWFTPTEAGAIGAVGALLLSAVRRRLTWEKFKDACWETIKSAGMIYAMIIGALLLNFFLAVSTIPTELANFANSLQLSPMGIMFGVIIIYFILGCFVDSIAMLLLTVPVFLPLITTLGYDPIWFGIMVVRMSEIGVLTPPVGLNVFTVAGLVPDVPISTIYKGVIPFLIADFFHVTLLILFPALVTFLPNLMM